MIIQTVLVTLALATSVCGALVPNGVSVRLNDVEYFVSPFPQGRPYDGSLSINVTQQQFGFVPVTIVTSQCQGNLRDLFTAWTTTDDVWQAGFLETIFIDGGQDSSKAVDGKYELHSDSRIVPLQHESNIPPGPYFLNTYTGHVHQVFRLYEDFGGSFSQSLLQQPDGRFQTLSAQISSSASITIGVPSRLYFTRTKEKPLAGVRVGVKDIFALAGVKSSYGSRAYYGLYPPANTTGTVVQNLIDAGAIIVGFQKPSQFANGEVPTADWVDYHAPFNPRGDGYLDPSSSSSGAGASMASYDWLDIALGSDTGGSIRGPAGNQGLFGNRPSHGLVSLDHAMPLSPTLDTPGFLVRDPYLWDVANSALYKENYTSWSDLEPKYPKYLYALDFPVGNTTQARILNQFAAHLAAFLNTTVKPLSLSKEWESSGPVQIPVSKLLNETYATLISKEQTQFLRDSFYRDYAKVHDGRLPFVDPVPLARWSWGDSQPSTAHSAAIANKTIFMDWFNTKILPPSSEPLECSSRIILHADTTGFLKSRNQYLNPPVPPFGFTNGQISIFAETPDSVFPIGQVPVFSSITNHTELLPVVVNVMVAKGCDGLIAKLAQDLVADGTLTTPKVGSTIEGGEILLRRFMS